MNTQGTGSCTYQLGRDRSSRRSTIRLPHPPVLRSSTSRVVFGAERRYRWGRTRLGRQPWGEDAPAATMKACRDEMLASLRQDRSGCSQERGGRMYRRLWDEKQPRCLQARTSKPSPCPRSLQNRSVSAREPKYKLEEEL